MTSGNDKIALSVVIVSWNSREFIAGCIDSVLADACRSQISVEVIVVDNNSHDATVEAVSGRFTDVIVIPLDQNIGFAAATNIGICRSRSGDILLLNPDTQVLPGALASMLRALHSMPHVGLVSGLLLNPDGSPQSSGYRFPGSMQTLLDFFPLHPRLVGSSINGRIAPDDGCSPYSVDHSLGACMLVRGRAVERVGLLDESYFMYSEEVDWCHRLRSAGWTILIAPSARIVHWGGQSTRQMPEEMYLELHRSRARYFSRYRGRGFLKTLVLMARAAQLWTRVRTRIHHAETGYRAESLASVVEIYRQAGLTDG